jgi:hypothetical protein
MPARYSSGLPRLQEWQVDEFDMDTAVLNSLHRAGDLDELARGFENGRSVTSFICQPR